jgi:hypothetical protein
MAWFTSEKQFLDHINVGRENKGKKKYKSMEEFNKDCTPLEPCTCEEIKKMRSGK